MSKTPISPLRARMIEDMSVRKFGEKTQKHYIQYVKTFSTFLGRSPATATGEDLRRYQVHQSKEGVSPATMNSSVAALRFFFRVTLNHPELGRQLTLVPLPQRLRVVLSQEEVAQLLEAAPGVKYKAAFSAAYGAGLRVSEVAYLKVSDIDSKRMLLREAVVQHTSDTLRLRRRWAASWVAMLLLLGPVQPLLAQTAGAQPKQLSDEEIGKRIAAADSYTVDAVNRHDAYAVAAVFWDDGIEVTPLGVFSGRAAIERHLTEQFKSTDVRDFAETIDEIHISGDHGWYITHWSATNVIAAWWRTAS